MKNVENPKLGDKMVILENDSMRKRTECPIVSSLSKRGPKEKTWGEKGCSRFRFVFLVREKETSL